jgi:hypothetical protein
MDVIVPLPKPLAAVDQILLKVQKDADITEQIPVELAEAILIYLNIPKREWRSDPVHGVLDRSLPQNSRSFVAACLVRLMAKCPRAFSQQGIRTKAFELLDCALADSLYKCRGIKAKEQTYAKEAALREALEEAEQTLEAATHLLTGIKGVEDFEKSFKDAIHRVPVQTLILPFMPRQKLEPLLRRLSAAVDSYCSSSVGNVIASLEEAVRAAQNLIAESDALETSYSRRYLGEPLRALVHELQADFEKS